MYRFDLEYIDFISPVYRSIEQIQHNQSEPIVSQKDSRIDLIPPIQRRRLNTAGKYSVAIGLQALKSINSPDNVSKIIYASRIGETVKCLRMLTNLLQEEEISPTDFSSSVQNSNVGLLSIISQFHGQTSSIASAENTFFAALTDAYISLENCHTNNSKILLVAYEDSLENEVMNINNNLLGPYALALVLNRFNENSNLDKLKINKSEILGVSAYTFAQNSDKYICKV